MKVYSSDAKYIIETDNYDVFDHGTYSNIYKLDDDTCFKVFKHENFHKPEPIILLKDLKLKNFYKIIDLLYDRNFIYSGYIMDYHQKDNYDILQYKELLVDSVNNINDGINELTKNFIQINDLHIDNVIVNSEGITVIDIDDYKVFKSDNTYINNFRYTQLLKSLLYDNLKRYDITDPMEGYALIKRLVNTDNLDINHFNNTMKRYKKPIDYFQKVIK